MKEKRLYIDYMCVSCFIFKLKERKRKREKEQERERESVYI